MTTYDLYNHPDIRPWPIMTAAQADDEIARLKSVIKSLEQANNELKEIIRKAVMR